MWDTRFNCVSFCCRGVPSNVHACTDNRSRRDHGAAAWRHTGETDFWSALRVTSKASPDFRHEVIAAVLVQTEEGDTLVAYIRRAIPQIRTDRRKVWWIAPVDWQVGYDCSLVQQCCAPLWAPPSPFQPLESFAACNLLCCVNVAVKLHSRAPLKLCVIITMS